MNLDGRKCTANINPRREINVKYGYNLSILDKVKLK
jgi:hypothetical protein